MQRWQNERLTRVAVFRVPVFGADCLPADILILLCSHSLSPRRPKALCVSIPTIATEDIHGVHGSQCRRTDVYALQAEAKMGKDLSTGNLKSHLQHNHRTEFQVKPLPIYSTTPQHKIFEFRHRRRIFTPQLITAAACNRRRFLCRIVRSMRKVCVCKCAYAMYEPPKKRARACLLALVTLLQT